VKLRLKVLLLSLAAFSLPASAQTIIEDWPSVEAPPAPELLPIQPDLATTALLVMDFNAATCMEGRRERCHAIIPAVADMLARARAAGMIIVYTHGPNMEANQFVPELAPLGDEPIYQRPFNKFYGSELEADLKDAGITSLILTGTAGVGAVFSTGIGAVERGFTIIVPVDGLASDTAYEDQFAIWYIGTSGFFRDKATLTRSDMLYFE
jgi:nicotinamidase-related amidase